MFDYIMAYVATGILLFLSLFACTFLLACLYPRLILKPDYRVLNIKDRGIKKYVFPTGRAITYQPSQKIRQYINSYVLSCVDEKKYIKCELDPSIEELSYELVVFDARDRVITVLQISDYVNRAGYSRSVLLPSDTAYVHLILREVDGEKISKEPIAAYHQKNIWLYFGAVILTVVVEVFFLKSNILAMSKGILFFASAEDPFTFWTAVLIGTAYAWVTFLLHRSRNTCVLKNKMTTRRG